MITSYAFGRNGTKIEAPDFDNDFHEACINGGRQLFFTRHFPFMLKLVKTIPPRYLLKLNPSMASFFQMHKVCLMRSNQLHLCYLETEDFPLQDIHIQAKALFEEMPGSRDSDGGTTVFHEILDSKLPPEEKSFPRLATDAGALMGAGTVTTAWALTVAVFHLVKNPDILLKLKQELLATNLSVHTEARDEADQVLPKLEKLPYLTAVIQEALRMSYGVASRLARIAPDEVLTVRDDTKDLDWTIPPGTPVSMTQLLVFRDERIFPSHTAFRPERWIEEPRLDRFQVAFCKGSRICLGKHLALAELYLMLASLFTVYGTKDVRMPSDVGYLELWKTDETDIECFVDAFVPLAKAGTQGVRCKVYRWN